MQFLLCSGDYTPGSALDSKHNKPHLAIRSGSLLSVMSVQSQWPSVGNRSIHLFQSAQHRRMMQRSSGILSSRYL